MRGRWGWRRGTELNKRMRSQISSCISSCRVIQGTSPGEILKPMNAGKAISGHFAVSILPELCLFADVSEEKVPIYSMLLNVFEVGRTSLVGCAYRLVSRRSQVRSSRPAHSFVEIWGYEKNLRPFSPFRCLRRAVVGCRYNPGLSSWEQIL